MPASAIIKFMNILKSEPRLRVREPVYKAYWKFAAERHRVFLSRLRGDEPPWTEDEIIAQFKFCNTFRAIDRVSQYMIRNVCYSEQKDSAEDRLFQIVAFRTFSKIETWEFLRDYLGRYPTLDDLSSGRFEEGLSNLRDSGSSLYTGAFILCANDAYGHGVKHLNHVALFQDMFLIGQLGAKILEAKSLEEIFLMLRSYPLYGDFMAYQTAIDINYSNLVDFSENDFVVPGPGALRGIAKVFEDTGGMNASDIIRWMVDHQEEEFSRLGIKFDGLFGRPLHLIDAQGLFCETDKYSRIAFPDIKVQRKRMKSKLKPKSCLPEPYLPPKWGIDIPEEYMNSDT